MRVGIAIDEWKLTILDRRLTKAGYTYEKGQGVTPDTLMLYVETDDKDAILEVVKSANIEAARTNHPGH